MTGCVIRTAGVSGLSTIATKAPEKWRTCTRSRWRLKTTTPAAGIPYGEDSSSVSLSGQCPGSATFHSVSRVVSDMGAELDDAYPCLLYTSPSPRDGLLSR